jgi:hypothetical protein
MLRISVCFARAASTLCSFPDPDEQSRETQPPKSELRSQLSSGNRHARALWGCPTRHRCLLHIYGMLRLARECSLEESPYYNHGGCNKSGAVAFLTKPIGEVAPIAGLERALDLNKTYRKEAFEHSPPRKQQVLPLLASGPLNKQPAGESGITENALQIHRGISCGKWTPIPSRLWLESPQARVLGQSCILTENVYGL